MSVAKKSIGIIALAVVILLPSKLGVAQAPTGAITGRVTDNTGALIPGVEVTITSPAMIGGPRTAPTDETGTYRFTLLVPGIYRVTFVLPGFKTLNIDGVNVLAGATMTINGTLEVATVAEEVTVVSQAPTIDLEAATVGVNWNKKAMDDLPWGRSIVALAAMIPGMRVTNYDVGGNQMGGSSQLSGRVYGRAGGEVRTFDGIAFDMGFEDFSSYEEVQLSAAAKGAESQNPGVTASFVIKSGGNEFHGTGLAAWEDDSFQSKNITKELLNRGFSPSPNNFTRHNEFSADLGGPILHNKFWFYTAYNDMYTGQHIAGFIRESTGEPAVYYVRLRIPTVKLTYQLNPSMKLETVAQYSQKFAPYRTGSQFVPLEATQNQMTVVGLGPSLKWTYIINPKMTTELSFARSGYWWPTIPHTNDVRRVDLTTSNTRGAFLKSYNKPTRWQWNGSWSYFSDIGGRNNEIKTGFLAWWDRRENYFDGYPNQQLYQYRSLPGDANFFLRPAQVQVFDYPTYTSSIVNFNSWFLNDKINLSRKLTLNVGVRYDRYSSYLPEQGNPGTGPFSTRNIYAERRDFPVYQSFVPRVSVAYDVKGDGTLAFKASYGRYAGAGTGPGASPGPSGANVNQAAVITRTYSNWDGRIPYVPVPTNLASTTGGGGIQRLDTNLKSPYLEEYTAGVQVGFRKDYLIGFTAVRKFDIGGSKTLDLAQPFSAYTDVRYAVDPGRDNVAGTSDDGVMQAWSVPRSYPTFGQVNQLTTQVADGEATRNYTAFEAFLHKQYSNKWSMLAAYTSDFSIINNVEPRNPNELIYNWQIPEWHHSVKMNGTYDLPFGLKYGSTYQIQSGQIYGRFAQMRNALNQNVTIRVEGNFGRYPTVRLWDNRVSKVFNIRDTQTLEVMFDLYNTLNASTILSMVTTNGPNFLTPTQVASGAVSAAPILPARIFKLGGRYRF
ncbi:MAG: TonB-dependent receptor [Acidobacteria bacterium]|nr:TonB-dependent receptor [Acidobacteriota bacterium]